MPLPVLPGVVRITASGSVAGGGNWSNTWHARNDSLIDFTSAGIIALDDIFSQFYLGPGVGGGAGQLAYWPVGTSLAQIAYTPLDGQSGAQVIAHVAEGEVAAAALPAEVAEVLTIRTGARGRQNRGRVFLPAWASDRMTTVGRLHPTTVGDTLDQIAAVHAAIITGGAHLGVGSYGPYKNPLTGIIEVGTPHFTNATLFSLDDRFDAQRSRKI